MSTEVQTMADLDDAPVALRTPLYLIISALGAVIFVASFLAWAGVAAANGSGDATSVSGLDAGGWGLGALIVGLVIAALGVLGYFWNPFSDPEAIFIAAFAGMTVVAALLKIADASSLIVGASDFEAPDAGPRIGLWLILIGALAALISAGWILYSRPKAQARLP